jgi:CDP-paratose synthetase
MKTILLTGATGFLGSHLLKSLVSQGFHVVILKRSTSDCWRINHLMDVITNYDLDQKGVETIFEEHQIDCVVHTACSYGRDEKLVVPVVEANVMLGLRVLDCAIRNGTQLFINTDTFFNTRNLSFKKRYLGDYILSKRQFVEWLEQKSGDIKVVNLKLQHVYGPDDSKTKFVPWMADQLLNNVSEIKLTGGQQERDFIYIDDVVSAFLTIVENQYNLSSFNDMDVGTGNLITVKDFVGTMHLLVGDILGEIDTKLVFGSLPIRDGELMTVDVDIAKLTSLGWSPQTSFDKGLSKLIDSMV